MTSDSTFGDLMAQVRAGNDLAAAELMRRYESAIRRSARLRLNPRLRRTCDSLDLSQAVLGSFFVRAAAGQYELDTPEQFLKLLTTMVRNKLAKLARHEQALCRDQRRVVSGGYEDHEIPSGQPSPSRQVAARELLEETRRRLSEEDWRILEMRRQGQNWVAIAAELGGTPEGRRKQLARSVERVAAELGLEDGHV